MAAHLTEIAKALAPLHPIVVYLAPPDIEGTIAQVLRERSPEWRDAVVQYLVGQAFGRTHQLTGWDGVLTFLRQRRALEAQILAQLPLDAVTIADDTALQRCDRVQSFLFAAYYAVS